MNASLIGSALARSCLRPSIDMFICSNIFASSWVPISAWYTFSCASAARDFSVPTHRVVKSATQHTHTNKMTQACDWCGCLLGDFGLFGNMHATKLDGTFSRRFSTALPGIYAQMKDVECHQYYCYADCRPRTPLCASTLYKLHTA
jgi:hypothetical protein